MKIKFLFKLVALMTIICVVGCSDDVGVGPKGKLYFSDSKSWKESGVLIYENFVPSHMVQNNKLILSVEDTDKHAVYKP